MSLVAERQVDRVPLASRAVGRRLAAAGATGAHRSPRVVPRPRCGSRLAALVARRTLGALRRREPVGRRSVPFVIGVDQATGEVTSKPREVPVAGFRRRNHARRVAARQRDDRRDRQGSARAATSCSPCPMTRRRAAHRPSLRRPSTISRAWRSSPDGRAVAFVAPAPDGFYQIFRLPLDGGAAAASHDRSRAQDAARLVARRPPPRVHGVELHRALLAQLT